MQHVPVRNSVTDEVVQGADFATRCPGCQSAMQAERLERTPLGVVTVDLCLNCQALWFDAHESTQLAPGAVIALFRTIHQSRPVERRPLPEHMACPRCRGSLVSTQDLTNTGPFTYYRCQRGHGRFTAFVQFLREKAFIRTIAPREIAALKTHVQVIHCSSCGAPVDIGRNSACPYCHAPIAVLDQEAVDKALAKYQTQDTARKTMDPVALVDAVLASQHGGPRGSGAGQRDDEDEPVDLVLAGLGVLAGLLIH